MSRRTLMQTLALVALLAVAVAMARRAAGPGPDGAQREQSRGVVLPGEPSGAGTSDDSGRARAAPPGDPVTSDPGDAAGEDVQNTTLLVRVIDGEGEPVPEALVRAARVRGPDRCGAAASWPAEWAASGRTGADGGLYLTLTAGRHWFLQASGEGAGDSGVADITCSSQVVLCLREAELRTVTVRSASGPPVEGAELFPLQAAGLGPATDRFVTGADGRATLRIAGRGALVARAPGFLDRSVASSADGDEIVLEPSLSVAGVVTDESGAPLPGARVAGAYADATTDAEGRFVLQGLRFDRSPGPFRVDARADDRVPWTGEAWPAVEDLRIEMRRGGVVRGRVVFEGGEAAAGVRVDATRRVDPESVSVRTGDAGDFVLRAPPGEWDVWCVACPPGDSPGLPAQRATATVRVVEGAESRADLRLVRPVHSWVCVRVLMPDGTVAPRAGRRGEFPVVSVEPVRDDGGVDLDVGPDEEPPAPPWAFSITADSVDPGLLQPGEGVTARRIPHAPGTRVAVTTRFRRADAPDAGVTELSAEATTFSAPTPDAEPLDLHLRDRVTVEVRLRVRPADASRAAAEVQISLRSRDWETPSGLVHARSGDAVAIRWFGDDDLLGRATIEGVGVASFRLPAPHTDGAEHEIVVRESATLRGRIVDVAGSPVGTVDVCVMTDERIVSRTLPREAGGKFRFSGLPPGSATIQVSPARRREALPPLAVERTIELEPGAHADAGDIVFDDPFPSAGDEPPGTALRPVTGRVLDARGRPVAAAVVHADTEVPLIVGDARWTALSGPDGRYRLDVATGRPVLLAFERPGFGTAVVRLPAVSEGEPASPAPDVDVRLGPGGDVRCSPTPDKVLRLPEWSESATESMRAMDDWRRRLVVRGNAEGIAWVPRELRYGRSSGAGVPAGTQSFVVFDGDRSFAIQGTVRAGELVELRY